MTEARSASIDPTISALREAIDSHDPDRVAASFTVDYRCELPMHPSRNFTGNEHVRANWAGIFARVPDIRAQILRSITDAASGESWSEWEMLGTTPSGDPAVFRGVVVSTARDGRIATTRFYLDPVVDDRGLTANRGGGS